MTRHETTACRGPRCARQVIWAAITKADGTPGKIPLDPKAPCYELVGTGGREADGATGRRAPNAYVSHFATCADVVRFANAGEVQAELETLRLALQTARDEVAVLQERLDRATKPPKSLFDPPRE